MRILNVFKRVPDTYAEVKLNSDNSDIDKENFVLCGIDIFEKVFKFLNNSISVEKIYKDGDFINESKL